MRTPRALSLALLFLVPIAFTGQATGTTIDIETPELLEAEAFSRPGFFCSSGDPTIVDDTEASGGKMVRAEGWCMLNFDALATSAWGIPTALVVRTYTSNVIVSASITIGSTSARPSMTFLQMPGLHVLPIQGAEAIAPGTHEGQIFLTPFSGPLAVDAVLFNFRGRDGCTNTPPTFTLAGNGMRDGFSGWVGAMYALQPTVTDAENDNVTFSATNGLWTGDSILGPLAGAVGANELRVTAAETGERCPDGPVFTGVHRYVVFEGVPAFEVDLVTPLAGTSCFAGDIHETGDVQLIVDSCPVLANVVAEEDILGATTFALDNTPFASDGGMAPRAHFIVRDTGPATLTACARAIGDVHMRSFCAQSYEFIGLPVRSLV